MALEAFHTFLFPKVLAASLTLPYVPSTSTRLFNLILPPLPVILGGFLLPLSLPYHSPCLEFLKSLSMYPGLTFPSRPISNLSFFKKLSSTLQLIGLPSSELVLHYCSDVSCIWPLNISCLFSCFTIAYMSLSNYTVSSSLKGDLEKNLCVSHST